MEPQSEQLLNNQATNEQPKKTWVEPELVSLGVESGEDPLVFESTYAHWDSNPR